MQAFSQHVLPGEPDWPPQVHTTGWWFLPSPESWIPPTELVAFLAAGPPPVYVGFGSTVGPDAIHVIDQLVGDLQRVIEYPRLGFAIEQKVPDHVLDSFTLLCEHGYTSRLLP